MNTFDTVSGEYKEKSLVQAAAAEKLIALIDLKGKADILDVGCGPGHITNKLRNRTGGKIVGTDISEGMIKQASEEYPDISFVTIAAADMNYEEKFDLVFCNSTFQWFKEPARPLDAMVKALKPGGAIAIACPATQRWSECFIEVAEAAGRQNDTRDVFKHWRSPWFWLNGENEYRAFFKRHGLDIVHLRIEKEISVYTPEQAFSNFISGAAQGFTGKDYYDIMLPDAFIDRFKLHAMKAMFSRVKEGRVEVDFQRLYFIGKKK